MSDKILVYIDQFKGEALPASWEAIGAAQHLAAKLGGNDHRPGAWERIEAWLPSRLSNMGRTKRFYCDDPSLADYRPEPYLAVLCQSGPGAGCQGRCCFPPPPRPRAGGHVRG